MDALAHIAELEQQGLVEEALRECSRLLRAEEADTVFKADLLRRKARLLDWYKSRYHECERLLRKELAIRRALHDKDTAETYFQIGLMLVFTKRDAEAIPLLETARVGTTDPLLLARAENLLGDILVTRDRRKARELLESSANRLQDIANDYMRCHVALSLAWLTAAEGNVVAGEAACRDELRHAEQLQSPGIVGTAHLRLAQVLWIAGRRDEAAARAREAERIGRENHWQVLVDEAIGVASGDA